MDSFVDIDGKSSNYDDDCGSMKRKGNRGEDLSSFVSPSDDKSFSAAHLELASLIATS